MPFTDEDKHFIKILRKGKSYTATAKLFVNFRTKMESTICSKMTNVFRLRKSQEVTDLKLHVTTTTPYIDAVADLVQVQEDRPQTHRNVWDT